MVYIIMFGVWEADREPPCNVTIPVVLWEPRPGWDGKCRPEGAFPWENCAPRETSC